jgi:2-methylcitrate dehydratase PrpD
VQASALAMAGVRGFEAPFEGKAGFFRLYAEGQYDPATILDRLGETFWIEQLSFKRWPACRGTHAYIEAAQILRARHGFAAEDVVSIVATGGEVQVMLVEPAERKQAPATVIDAKFSIPFTIAAALIDHEVTLDSFDDLADPAKRALSAKVRFERRLDWGRDRAASGGLAIELADGRRVEEWIDVAAGHVSRPISDEALTAKFLDCARRARQPLSGAEQVAAAIWAIDGARDAAVTLALN